MTARNEAPTVTTAGAGSWLRWATSIVFGLLYTYFIWAAVAALALAAAGSSGLNAQGWLVFLLPVIFPAAVFIAAFVFARRMRVWQLAIVFVAGLALVAVFWLNVVTFQITSGTSLLAS